MLLLCSLFAHRSETLAADLAGPTAKCSPFGGNDGASAQSFVFLDTVPATAYFGGSLVVCSILSNRSRDE